MSPDPAAEIRHFQDVLGRLRAALGSVIVGQEPVIDGVLTALVAGGHVLLEGVPGLGKTELVKALARCVALPAGRIQFTPDLMPADIVGTTVMSQAAPGDWRLDFRPGPVFTHLLLADEINRATPKTQSALLETMAEGCVTAGGATRPLPQPFIVLATQNPLEQEGTYPLPEAQLDRFLLKLLLPFPSRAELAAILDRTALRAPAVPEAVVDGPGILRLRAALDGVVVAEAVRDHAVALVSATHPGDAAAPELVRRAVRWGASPRAAQALIRAGRVRALAQGRGHLACEDLRHHAPAVLRHRIILSYDGQADGVTTDQAVAAVLAAVAAP